MQTPQEAQQPKRKSPRATFHNYSGGCYFVTICTVEKKHYFGTVINNEMHYTRMGVKAKEDLERLSMRIEYCEIPLFVVMPNHIHAIIHITQPHEPAKAEIPAIRSALSVIVGLYKSGVTTFARRHNIKFGWQPRYHDHIIRGVTDRNRIADYINNNVARWADDCFYSLPTSQMS